MKNLFKKTVLFVVMIAVLSGATVYGKVIDENKGQVAKSDIKSLKQNANKTNVKVLSDEVVEAKLINGLSSNKEIQTFTGLTKNQLEATYNKSYYAGKSKGNDVYQSSIESGNISIVTSYDIQRDLLLDAYIIDHTNQSAITITSKNLGLMMKAPLSDLIKLKEGKDEKLKEKYRNQFNQQNKPSVKEKIVSTVTNAISIDSVDAGFCGSPGMYGSTTCDWISVPYCAVAGLLGFWPGLVCGIVFVWGCKTC